MNTNFNSRPREGANGVPCISVPRSRCISIPAPARGRTIKNVVEPFLQIFQFPPPRGGELNDKAAQAASLKFQFPPPRGGEPWQSTHGPGRILHFNSRPREGANSKTAQNRAVYLVSLLKFGRISAILPYILSATRAKKRETPKIIGFLLRRPTGKSCMEQVGAGGGR